MIVIGLTGSIGMGKSTTADMFRWRGVPVHDSDRTVHDLYSGEAVPLVEAAFPGVTLQGRVDRERLATKVLGNADELRKLESIVHPLVRAKEALFLTSQAGSGASIVVIDIPLLFESREVSTFDVILVVSASPDIQRERVLSRPGMTEDKFASILRKQTPDQIKRARAHAVIDTGLGLDAAASQVDAFLQALWAAGAA